MQGADTSSVTVDDSAMFNDDPLASEAASEQTAETGAPPVEAVTESIPSQGEDVGQQSEPEEESPSLEIEAQAQSALAAAGLDIAQFTQEFQESGGLSEESFEKLEKEAGIPRSMVEQYIAGQQLLAEQTVQSMQDTAFGLTGGQDQYTDLTQWASQSLSPSEIEEFNSAVSSVNKERVENAIRSLIHKRETSEGFVGNRVTGGAVSGSGSNDIFQDSHQVQEAIANPLYQSSTTYRSQVEAKLGRSMKHFGGKVPR